MRIMMMAVLALLAGCGPGQFYSPERMAERVRAGEAERNAYQQSPSGQAEMSCATKVQFAMAGNPIRGGLDVAGVVRQQQMQAQCMDYWRRTGQMP
jgi:hypothetical protein